MIEIKCDLFDYDFCREIDVIIGGLSYGTGRKLGNFLPTSPYYRDDLTWCVKKADRLSTWLNIFAVFKNLGVPLALALLFMVTVVLFFAVTAFEPKPLHLLETLVIAYNYLLCSAYPYSADRNGRIRFIIIYFAIVSMIIAIHYTSFYTAFMITPNSESQVASIGELINGHFKLAGEIDAVLMLKQSKEVL